MVLFSNDAFAVRMVHGPAGSALSSEGWTAGDSPCVLWQDPAFSLNESPEHAASTEQRVCMYRQQGKLERLLFVFVSIVDWYL